ncbi:hypothetical protein QMK33_05745 [Hymenobacter sp. H14-R3]|uniref:hypothetical protein n=1 Tax=Hymenobacter sp. H14-R3 TaxID=3046308 RepID=UPI0024B9353B|nr:hypothetical protein [Hymenobacter sp. H14-R3]MDJ0364648.1 hypothetical protein [Hymenobacter sp. H14-R3]
MTERILVLAEAQRAALGTVRDQPGLLVAADAGQLWLRGLPATGPLPLALRQLPALAAYVADAAGRLFPAGRPTPTGRLPLLAWQPITAFVPLELPTAALPGQPPALVPVRLVPSAQPRPGAALRTSLAAWQAYAETAPAVRLACLRFAVSSHGQALLLGTPLPPLPGQEYWLASGLLLPAGFEFELPIAAPLVAAQLTHGGERFVLFEATGQYEVVPTAQLHPATRAAIRLTFI